MLDWEIDLFHLKVFENSFGAVRPTIASKPMMIWMS
jgi:hypothetical protein